MIQKIRYRFIYMSTIALFIVLITLIGSIVGTSYYRAKQQIDNVLLILLQNNGKIDSQINTQDVKKDLALILIKKVSINIAILV